MDKRWNLDALYTGFDSPELKANYDKMIATTETVEALVSELKAADEALGSKLLNIYQEMDALTDLIEGIYSFGHLTYAVDTSNTEALKLVEKMQAFFPRLSLVETKLIKVLKDVDDLDTIITNTKGLADYKFVLTEAKKRSKYMLSEAEELLLAEMSITGSKAWSTLQNKIVSTLTGTYRGKEETITVLRSKAYEADQSVRREAYEAELKAYEKMDTSSAACLNAIKGEALTVCKKRGYDSPLDMTLKASRIDKETLDAMMTAIKEYLPEFRKYLKKKAEMLGYKNGLPFYELFAPVGEVEMRYTYDEARDFIVKQFTSFSEKLGTFAAHAFDNDWIDPFPREGKVAGAFCSNQHSIKESRVMSNFSGSFSDMTTLAHELGHAYHGDCLKNTLAANSDYPMPLAETASIFCETIVFNAALANANDAEKTVVIENSLMGATQVIVDIYSRFLFESKLFELRENASLSVDEIKNAMLEAQKEAYGDSLDPEFLHPYMWMCKPHYYSAGLNFYNFPYAFGQLFAQGLYALYQKDANSFIAKYDELLLATGCHGIHDVLKIVDIDSYSPDFFRGSLEILKKQVDEFLAL